MNFQTPFPFPEVLDNTFISAFRDCPQKAYYHGVMRIVPAHASNTNLIAGGAFARGLEITRKAFFDDNETFDAAQLKGLRALIAYYGDHEPSAKAAVKDVWRTALALVAYFTAFPIDQNLKPVKLKNNKHAIEYSFAVPLDIKNPQTNDPLLYTGRFDFLGITDGGMLVVVDEKTSTTLGDQWIVQWQLSNQMSGYVWASQSHGIPVENAWIRGLAFLKNGYSTTDYITPRPQWLIKTFKENLNLTLNRIIESWRTNKWEKNFGKACASFGGCPYLTLCSHEHPEDWIPINFKPNDWNPLH